MSFAVASAFERDHRQRLDRNVTPNCRTVPVQHYSGPIGAQDLISGPGETPEKPIRWLEGGCRESRVQGCFSSHSLAGVGIVSPSGWSRLQYSSARPWDYERAQL